MITELPAPRTHDGRTRASQYTISLFSIPPTICINGRNASRPAAAGGERIVQALLDDPFSETEEKESVSLLRHVVSALCIVFSN